MTGRESRGTSVGGRDGDAAPRQRLRQPLIALAIVWLIAVSGGMCWLGAYASAAGPAATPPERWPAESGVPRSTGLPSLLMFVHPQCACSRASLEELARVMTAVQGRPLQATVLVLAPDTLGREWSHAELWEQAAAIPDVSVLADTDGIEGRRFGAATSGQTLVYDAAGRLRFSGGITRARGHSGDNPGRDAVVSVLNADAGERSQAAVFGCALNGPDAPAPGAAETGSR